MSLSFDLTGVYQFAPSLHPPPCFLLYLYPPHNTSSLHLPSPLPLTFSHSSRLFSLLSCLSYFSFSCVAASLPSFLSSPFLYFTLPLLFCPPSYFPSPFFETHHCSSYLPLTKACISLHLFCYFLFNVSSGFLVVLFFLLHLCCCWYDTSSTPLSHLVLSNLPLSPIITHSHFSC